jgi:UDP-glucose 4-epimerase
MRNEKVLVTGGAGFIGSHLAEALVAEGAEVTVLDDLSSGNEANLEACRDRVRFIRGSILDEDALAESAEGCATIFHLAAVVSVPRSVKEPLAVHDTNATGTLRVFEAARKVGAKVVFSSSAAVYGDQGDRPATESLRPAPLSPYGVQKLLGEQYAQVYHRLFGMRSVGLRYFNVYGPRQDPQSPYSGVISIFAERARRGEPITIHGDGSQTRDFVYVGDVVRANLLAADAECGDGRPLNVGTGVRTPICALAERIREISGGGGEIRFGPPRAGDIHHSCADVASAETSIRFGASKALQEGLALTLQSP